MSLQPLGAILLAVGLLAAASPALAGDIYRCEGQGSKSLVDSPTRCPSGRATRIGSSTETPPAAPSTADVLKSADRSHPFPKRERRTEPTAESFRPRLESAGPVSTQVMTPYPVVPRVPVPPATAATVCAPLRNDAARLRKCLAAERRKEVRIIASGRLVQVSAAAAELVGYARTGDGLLAVWRDGRPKAWCEELLGDLLHQRRLEVIDDETVSSPAWVRGSGNDLRSIAILDSNYMELDASGGLVAWGYVTLRWKQQRTLVVRTRPACVPISVNLSKSTCNTERYTSIDIHDDEMPQACSIMLGDRRYWPQWQDRMVEIRAPAR